jgi:hypothetical protein
MVRASLIVEANQMSIDPAAELIRFQQFICEHLKNGGNPSPEEALDLWRAENPRTEDFDDTVQALREALDDMDAGDTGVTLDEFDRAFRKRHGLPASP